MDIDPADDNSLDAGAIEDDDDDDFDTSAAGRTAGNKRRRKNADTTAEDEARDQATPSNLDPRDPGNFLKLSRALQILTSRTITEEDLLVADKLLREYCTELIMASRFSWCPVFSALIVF